MVKAKKSLGQNWLKSESAIKEIVKTAELAYHEAKPRGDELVLEIGPGRGVLAKALLETGAKVLAVEKDDRLIEELQEKFATEIADRKLILIHDDILNLDFSNLLSSLFPPTPHLLIPKYKLVANIPYYITGQVIRKFLSEEKIQPSRIVLMMQKEVAKRITVTDKESLLSLSVKIYGTPKYIKTVPAGAFEPQPKVDSAILLIENISRNFFSDLDETKFFTILKKGFAQKRKLLKGNLGIGEEVLVTCNIPTKARAENLTIENWKCLAVTLGGSTSKSQKKWQFY